MSTSSRSGSTRAGSVARNVSRSTDPVARVQQSSDERRRTGHARAPDRRARQPVRHRRQEGRRAVGARRGDRLWMPRPVPRNRSRPRPAATASTAMPDDERPHAGERGPNSRGPVSAVHAGPPRLEVRDRPRSRPAPPRSPRSGAQPCRVAVEIQVRPVRGHPRPHVERQRARVVGGERRARPRVPEDGRQQPSAGAAALPVGQHEQVREMACPAGVDRGPESRSCHRSHRRSPRRPCPARRGGGGTRRASRRRSLVQRRSPRCQPLIARCRQLTDEDPEQDRDRDRRDRGREPAADGAGDQGEDRREDETGDDRSGRRRELSAVSGRHDRHAGAGRTLSGWLARSVAGPVSYGSNRSSGASLVRDTRRNSSV